MDDYDDDYENPVGETLDPDTISELRNTYMNYASSVVTAIVGTAFDAANLLLKAIF